MSDKTREDWLWDYAQIRGQDCKVTIRATDPAGGWTAFVVPASVLRRMFAPLVTPTDEEKQLIAEQVMTHAEKHYEDGGWDVLYECYTVGQIVDLLWNPDWSTNEVLTFEDAIADLESNIVSVWAERESDAQISAGEFGEKP